MMNVPDDASVQVPTFTDPHRRRRLVVWAIVRVVVMTAFVVAAYFAAPVGQDADFTGLIVLIVGGAGFVGALVFQVRRILDSPAPQLRAAEAIATTGVIVIVVFAFTYVCMSVSNSAAFSEPVTKVNGLYFTVTVLATVGFGDITPTTETSRLVVTGQMLLNLLIVGVVVRIIIGASRIGVERRRSEADAARTGSTAPAEQLPEAPSDPASS
ncbi:MAG TPA: potassium channel family protein [Acidimicrobiales bacterium]